MIYGTHNSATGGSLVWWLRPFGWLIHLVSRCQSRTIEEQLEDGVRLFNLQVTKYGGEWVFSHGTAIYKEELIETLALMSLYATDESPIYYQLYLDDNLIMGQPEEDFYELVADLHNKFKNVIMLTAWVEGYKTYFYKNKTSIKWEEHYWTLNWAKKFGKSLLDWLPLPKRHAKKYNESYKKNCKTDYLMLDFYEIPNND